MFFTYHLYSSFMVRFFPFISVFFCLNDRPGFPQFSNEPIVGTASIPAIPCWLFSVPEIFLCLTTKRLQHYRPYTEFYKFKYPGQHSVSLKKTQILDGPTERLKAYNKQLLVSKDSGYFKGNILLDKKKKFFQE